jgi:murein DD-endopeptidase MepM/ murein hydrolase activator NlpD
MYAHLNSIDTTVGATFTQPTLIGTCGDTGNSSGPHLHLEVRASRNANEKEWATMRPALLDPTILFSR